MNQLKKLAKKQARKVGMTLLVFILLIGALATPFVALNEYLEHPISITFDILFGGNIKIELGENINARVLKYKSEIEKWTAKSQNGYIDVSDYENVLLAIMMTESGGNGNDPMQASECGKNTRYPRKPNGITDPSYSIECGVKDFADGLLQATDKGLTDTKALFAAIDGYNKGLGIIGVHAGKGSYLFETSCQYCYEHRFSSQKKSYSTAASLKKQFDLKENKYWDGGNWRWNYGNMFYVYNVLSYLHISEAVQDDGTLGNKIALKAQKKIGCRYWWGKSGPDYFDCSGLIYWCHKEAGISISRNSAEGYSHQGTEIAYGDLKAGDIVTFDWDGDSKADHAGIFMGNDYMIHAHGNSSIKGNSSKYVVEKKNIASGYYRKHLLSCRRLY